MIRKLALLLTALAFSGAVRAQTIVPAGGSGGSSTPGGSTTQVQYNNASSFGGITGATTDGAKLTLVAPVLGAATATTINGVTIPSATDTAALLGTAQTFTAAQGISAALTLNTGGATILTSPAAAKLHLGAADAAAPAAQTLGVQGVVAGTLDTAGPAFSVAGAVATGAGAPGVINLQTGSAGNASATTQNAVATVATVGPSSLLGSSATAALTVAPTWNTTGVATALKVNVTNTASGASSLLQDWQVGGVSKFAVNVSGQLINWNRLQGGSANVYIFDDSSLMSMASAFNMRWTNGLAGGTADSNLSRISAGVIGVGTGSQGSVAGAIEAQTFIAGGSPPTLTGTCITGSQVGGNTAGSFTAACTAQTVIITFATTAPNGWACNAQDESTSADLLKQTAHSTTSCTLSGTTGTGNVIVFNAVAF